MSDYRRRLAFRAGFKAGEQGKPETDCNRPSGTIYFDDWMDGHREGTRAAITKATPEDRS